MNEEITQTGYPSIDKPWLKYYSEDDITAPLPKCSIFEMMWENNKNNLDAIAIEYFGRKITYRSLFDSVNRTAKAFAAAGIKSGDIVIIASVTLPETIYSIYALNLLGAVPNMVDPRTSTDGIRGYIEEVSSPMVITIDIAFPKIMTASQNTTVKTIVSFSAADSMPFYLKAILKLKTKMGSTPSSETIPTLEWRDFIEAGRYSRVTEAIYESNKCCMIVHTGGTTGMPKGVMLSDDNVNAAFHQAFHSPILMKRGDVFLNIMPPFIAYGMVLGIHTALCWGWKSVIIPKFNPAEFDKLLLKHRPNGLIGVPSYFENLMDSRRIKNADLSFVKVVLAGGDKTPAEFEGRVNAFLKAHNANIHLTKGYSMTEASATATVSFENTIKPGSNGVPLARTVISAFEEGTDHELPCGELGEICLNTPTIMMGYYQNDAATSQMVWTHSDGLSWIHTGDLGYVDKDGHIFIEGRLKRMIVRYDGFKVFPPFIEKVVLSNPAVDACCAVGQKDKAHGQGQLPFVFCVLKSGTTMQEGQIISELNAACISELPEYSQPVGFRFLQALPLTPIGKIDYRTLEEMAKENTDNT